MGKDSIKTLLKTAENYYLGKEVKKDFEKAFGLYLEVIEQEKNNAKANYRLGMCFYKGRGTEKNRKKGIKHLKIAAENGSASAALQLGKYYMSSKNNKDPEAACKYYEIAAAKGDVTALNNLGDVYSKGLGVQTDFKKALEYYTDAAKHEDLYAMYRCGQFYFNGMGTNENKDTAYEFWTAGANAGEINCAFMMGRVYWQKYYEATQNHIDHSTAASYMEKLLAFFNIVTERCPETIPMHHETRYKIALAYALENGVCFDFDKAILLFSEIIQDKNEASIKWRAEAQQSAAVLLNRTFNDPDDQQCIAKIQEAIRFAWGNESERNIHKAIRLFEETIDVYDSVFINHSIIGLSLIFRNELFDPKKSFDMSMSCAKKGHLIGIFLVGFHYKEGIYVEKNEAEAEKWMNNLSAEDKETCKTIMESFENAINMLPGIIVK